MSPNLLLYAPPAANQREQVQLIPGIRDNNYPNIPYNELVSDNKNFIITTTADISERLAGSPSRVYADILKTPGCYSIKAMSIRLNIDVEEVKAAIRVLKRRGLIVTGISYTYYPRQLRQDGTERRPW